MSNNSLRTNSFGENHSLSIIERFGIWLSTRKVRSLLKKNRVSSLGDFGCGFNGRLLQIVRENLDRAVAIDVRLSPEINNSELFESYEGYFPEVLSHSSIEPLNMIVMNSVLEHLDKPTDTLIKLPDLLSQDGILFVNVPSWFGKRILEFVAFKFNLSRDEMEDHRRYYNKRELWIELRKAGFMPSKIRIRYHKFGTNVFALVKK